MQEITKEVFPFSITSDYFSGTVYNQQDLEEVLEDFVDAGKSENDLLKLKLPEIRPTYAIFSKSNKDKTLREYLYG